MALVCWGAALKQWDVLKDLSPSEQEDIRSFVVFWSGYSALYITSRDEVCGIGNNGVNLNLLGLTGTHYRINKAEQPVEIKCLSKKGLVAISMGVYLGAALDREGWLYWWGCVCENYGEIRTPHLASDFPRYTLVSCGAMFIAALSSDGWVYVWGRFWNTEKFFKEDPLLTTCYVTYLSCGVGHLAMVTNDGQVFTWGDGRLGQRGYSSYRYPEHDDIVRRAEIDASCSVVKSGGHSTLFLSTTGQVWACGANNGSNGFLGVGSPEEVVRTPQRVALPEPIMEVVAGWSGTLLTSYAALTENGSVYVWGKTDVPQLVTSVGTSLVGTFLGLSTPRDIMIQVRRPSLVPPTSSSSSSTPTSDSDRQDAPKRGKFGNLKYLDLIKNHFNII
uniref:Putative E3 ubiquitin-protein ligase HERC2 n=1 Tax=Lygus hesperus TaxID=30085 RepID=A0A0A9Z5R7_LYGHE